MILVVGLSHRTAPLQVRERLAAGGDALSSVLARLAGSSDVLESMFVSTCNRVEVFALASDERVPAALQSIRRELARHGGLTNENELDGYLYEIRGDEAVRHMFRVAASLDSMVLGEPQVLGQVKAAYDAAVSAGALKGKLQRCVNKAFTVAKRVRTETAIGAGSVSISSVAVDLARRVFGDLADHVVLLLGAGEMAEAAARSLGQGARALRVCNRSFDRAAALAREMRASAVPWDGLEAELVEADVVVASTGATTPIVTRDMVKRVMKARRGRTLLFADIAVPRNVEPTVHAMDNVYVYNVDDLEQEVRLGRRARSDEVESAEKIVADEVGQYLAWSRGLEVQPTVVALRARARAVLLGELERSLGGKLKHLEGDRAALTQMLESAVNKWLHSPTTRLRSRAAEGDDGGDLASVLRFLFDLQELAVAREQDGVDGGPRDGAKSTEAERGPREEPGEAIDPAGNDVH